MCVCVVTYLRKQTCKIPINNHISTGFSIDHSLFQYEFQLGRYRQDSVSRDRIAIILDIGTDIQSCLINICPTELLQHPVLGHLAIAAGGVDIAQGRHLGRPAESTTPPHGRQLSFWCVCTGWQGGRQASNKRHLDNIDTSHGNTQSYRWIE